MPSTACAPPPAPPEPAPRKRSPPTRISGARSAPPSASTATSSTSTTATSAPRRAPYRTPCGATWSTPTWGRTTPWSQCSNARWNAVRRRLAQAAGCDPEEMAITRNASESLENAQYGIDLQRGDEVLTTDQDYPRMLTTFAQRQRREGIVLKTISFPVPPPSMDDLYQPLRAGRHAAHEDDPAVPHHQSHRPDLSRAQDLPDGARAQYSGDRGWRARLQPFPLQDLRPGLRLLRHQPAQVDLRADRHGLPLRAQEPHREHLEHDGERARRRTTIFASSRRSARIRRPITTPSPKRCCSTRTWGSTARRRGCATCATAGPTGWRSIPSAASCTARTRPNPAVSVFSGSRPGVDGGKMREALVEQVQHPDDLHASRGVQRTAHHAEYLQHDSRYRLLSARRWRRNWARRVRRLAGCQRQPRAAEPALTSRATLSSGCGGLARRFL